MANFVYNEAKRMLAAGELDWDSNDIRVMLVMTNTTADTEDDINTISGFTTLDECNAVPYARQAIANELIREDPTNNRAELDGDDVTFSALGSTTPSVRSIQGAIVYKHVGADSANVPIAFFDTGGFPFATNGGDVTIQFDVEGILLIS